MDKKKTLTIRNSTAEFLIFTSQAGEQSIEVRYRDETIWLTQKMMAELFDVDVRTVSEHLRNIFESEELDKKVVCRDFRHTTKHGAIKGGIQIQSTKYYNLKAITAVGYRVNSHRAIEFRKWATKVLHEYIIKGFAMNDDKFSKKYLTQKKDL